MSIRTGWGAIGLVLAIGVSPHAAATRYLIQFRTSNQVTANALSSFANIRVTQNLPQIKMAVIETDDAVSLMQLNLDPAIARVEEEVFHPPPQPVSAPAQATDSRPSTVPLPWGLQLIKAPQAWAASRGRGARVMVLDSGIDQGHPALSGQIEAAENFTSDDGADVQDDNGHGTHVAGTILANGLNGGLVGVAPEAKLLSAKVCTALGCSSVAIASGLNWAVVEKVDVVNLSIGGPTQTDGETQALQVAEDNGVMVVAASGNAGQPTVFLPGATPSSLAVGAIDESLARASFSNWGPQLAVMAPGVDIYSSVPRGTGRASQVAIGEGIQGLHSVNSRVLTGSPVFTSTSKPLVFCGLGNPTDFPARVNGNFALITRGENKFIDKLANAFAAGAIGVVFVNSAPGLISATVVANEGAEAPIPAVMIEPDGNLAEAIAQGESMTMRLAVVPTDYAALDGTSMATPHVVGVAALVRAVNKTLSPAQVRALLKSTATPLFPNDQNQMGSGLVNAEAAVSAAGALQLAK